MNRITPSMQNHFDKTYQSAQRYASNAYQHSMAWITKTYHQTYQSVQSYVSNTYHQTCTRLPEWRASGKRYTFKALNTGKTLAWTHKKWIIGGAVIGIALWILHDIWKKRPQYPLVELKSTADVAVLSVRVPEQERVPINASLTVCVDTSGSMGQNNQHDRADRVKSGVNDILTNAQHVVDTTAKATIEIALITFDKVAEVVCPAIQITPTPQKESMSPVTKSIKEKLDGLKFLGDGTKILLGLEKSVEEVEKMARKNPNGSHTLIFLTDGEDGNMNIKALKSIHERLTAIRAKLFAIGIGAGHSKETLQQIADPQTFGGTYIDTTLGVETIESAISKIYKQAISSFHQLELTAPQLAPGTWSVLYTPNLTENGQEKCKLGSLSEEQTLVKALKIHGHKLSAPLYLPTLTFNLTFIDPKGRRGTLVLPWTSDTTTLDNEVALAVENIRTRRT